MKTSAAVFDAINELERRFPVTAWRAGDIDLWPSYRTRLYGAMISKVLQNEAGQPTGRIRQLARRAFRALLRVPLAKLRDWRNNAATHAPATAVFFSDGVSFVRLQNLWVDRVIDPVIEVMQQHGQRCLKLTPLAEAHVPRYLPSSFVQPALDRIKLTARASGLPVETPEFDALTAAAHELGFEQVPDRQWLALQAARLDALARWFGAMFTACGARHAFVNTYYSLEGQAFVLAARRAGMRSYDVQHGIQGPHHVAYARWVAVPARGYSTLPDEFWVWGTEEASTIDAWRAGSSAHVPRVTGNFWLQRWCDDADPLVRDYLAQATALRRRAPEKKQVLVCLTWGVPESENDKLIEAAKRCSDAAAWWWRLHPVLAGEHEAFARRLEQHGLDGKAVKQATDLPLYALVRSADVVVAHSSTVVQEAVQLGVPAVVTSEFGAEVFADLVRSGTVGYATEPAAIAAAVTSSAAPPANIGKAAAAASLAAAVGSALVPVKGSA